MNIVGGALVFATTEQSTGRCILGITCNMRWSLENARNVFRWRMKSGFDSFEANYSIGLGDQCLGRFGAGPGLG